MHKLRSAATRVLPDLESLEHGLAIALRVPSESAPGVQVVERRPNVHASSLPSEFITCRLPDGRQLDMFCKYTGESFDTRHGHRQLPGFEGDVYQKLINPLSFSAPCCYGVSPGINSQGTWLFIESISDSARVTEFEDQHSAMGRAAGEIASLHRYFERADVRDDIGFLRSYSREYYLGWIRRTAEFGSIFREHMPWLDELCKRCEDMMEPLLDAPQTVIHGEFYPHNVLCRDSDVYLIDWQSTAIGPGEIDLASLTEKWPNDIVEVCRSAYVNARWPDGAPSEFELTLAAARLYLVFRWLGDRPEWTMKPRSKWGFEQLRQLAVDLGLTSE